MINMMIYDIYDVIWAYVETSVFSVALVRHPPPMTPRDLRVPWRLRLRPVLRCPCCSSALPGEMAGDPG